MSPRARLYYSGGNVSIFSLPVYHLLLSSGTSLVALIWRPPEAASVQYRLGMRLHHSVLGGCEPVLVIINISVSPECIMHA